MDTDGRCGHDAGVHVDEMYENEDSTQDSPGQTEEGIPDPKWKEEDEGRISYGQVEHVDVGVCPKVPFGDEDTQSRSIDKETQEEHNTVTHTLKGLHLAIRVGDVGGVGGVGGVVAHTCQMSLFT